MDFIKEWITNIILFVLLATVIDMLLPSSNMQKYTKLVTGLLLIAIILTPILKLISSDFEKELASMTFPNQNNEKNMENLIEMKKKEIQATQHAYILETMAVQLKEDAQEELINQYGVKITNIDFLIDEQDQRDFPENLEKVIVKVVRPEQKTETVEVVGKIDINSGKQPSSPKQKDEAENGKITSLLSKKWKIEKNNIEVLMVEGGINNQNG